MCLWRFCRNSGAVTPITDHSHVLSSTPPRDASAGVSSRVLEDVYMIDHNLTYVSMDIFDKHHTRHVRLSRNMLNALPDDFGKLWNLRLLDASDNQLTSISSLSIWIKHLNLERNRIVTINGCMNYTYLQTLKLGTCNIVAVPEEIGHLISLEVLELHENQITTIHPNIGKLVRLEKLSLHCNKLCEVPESLGNLRKLWYLSLHYNKLIELPKSFGQLTSLMRLSLHQNLLTTLPEEMSNCEHLEVISLFKNRLETLPEKLFTGWQKCKKLALQQNNLTELPSTITFLISLEELWVYHNFFEIIPVSLAQVSELTSLKRLWIDKCFEDECLKWNVTHPTINYVPTD